MINIWQNGMDWLKQRNQRIGRTVFTLEPMDHTFSLRELAGLGRAAELAGQQTMRQYYRRLFSQAWDAASETERQEYRNWLRSAA